MFDTGETRPDDSLSKIENFYLDSTYQAGQVRDKERNTGEHRELQADVERQGWETQNSFYHRDETLAFIATNLMPEQRNSKACGRVKARPLTYPSGRRTNFHGRPAKGKPD